MCLEVKQKFKTRQEARDYKPLIAEKDILVYKLLNEFNKSIYRKFQFEKGYQYTENNFSKKTNWFWKIYDSEKYWCLNIHQGLHAFVSTKRAYRLKRARGGKLVKMYIPKGSKYYIGNDGDIVSNNLIWY